MDHPCDHAVLQGIQLEESLKVAASTSVSQDIQAPTLPQDTPAFEALSLSLHEDRLPQLTGEQKEELMRLHTQLTSEENPVNQITSSEFEEPRDQTAVYYEIFKDPPDGEAAYNAILGEPQDMADVNDGIWGEPSSESDDGRSTSEEDSDQEEWTPPGKSKARGRPTAKSNVKRKYTKRNSAKTQGSEGS